MECLMPRSNDFSRSLAPFEQNSTLVAVIELSQSTWLIAGTVPGIERQPLKKITPDEMALLHLLHRWRDEAIGKPAYQPSDPLRPIDLKAQFWRRPSLPHV
jgi:hypothetical protein